MNNHTQTLFRYVDALVEEHATYGVDGLSLSIHSLSDEETNKLLFLKLEENNREMDSVFFQPDKRNSHDDCVSAFMRILMDDDQHTRDSFVETILANAFKNYSDDLQSLIDETCSLHERDDNHSHRKISYIDRITGEKRWIAA